MRTGRSGATGSGGAGGAEQRSSGARWKKEGGEEAADERALTVRETGAAALAGLRVEGGASAGPARAVGCGPSGERRGRSGPVLD